jgi:hypothetical protein
VAMEKCIVLTPVVATLLRVLRIEGRRSARRVAVSATPPAGMNIDLSEMVTSKALVLVVMSN